MKDIRKLNIWKEEKIQKADYEGYLELEIAELNLSVRSYNCLKRAGCNQVKDIYNYIDEEQHGLLKIRNLGARSEKEILERLEEIKDACKEKDSVPGTKMRKLVKPRKSIWDTKIDQYSLSSLSMIRLKECGIRTIRDLYATNAKCEPGWYAVRELFEKLPLQ